MALKWLRKNNKKLLAIVGVPIIVMFLLPNVMNRMGSSDRNPDIGYFTDAGGQQLTITANDLRFQARLMQALRALGIDRMSQSAVFSRIPELGAINPLTNQIACMLLFGEGRYNIMVRDYLYEQAGDWVTPGIEYETSTNNIDLIAESSTGMAGIYFWMLAEEAHRSGIYATERQIDVVIEVCQVLASKLRSASWSAVLNQFSLTNKQLRQTVGDYVAILRYSNMLANSLTISQPQLKNAIRDIVEQQNVTGQFARYSADIFADQVPQPTEQQLQDHFELYKQYLPGEKTSAQEKPHQFGYKLPDRVQVEFLKVDITVAKEQVTKQFEQKTAIEQEEILQQYWSENQNRFRVPVAKPADQQDQQSEPEYRLQSYDEVAQQVKTMWLQDQATQKAQQLIAEAQRLTRHKMDSSDTDAQPQVDDTHADYAAIAQQLISPQLEVTYSKSDFLSPQTAETFEDFRMAYQARQGVRQQSLINLLFACEPLRARQATRLDEPPLRLYEDVTSILAFDYSNNPQTAYMLRIVAVDKARVPVSLDDDGRQGPADQPFLTTGVNQLKEQVKQDWQDIQAYQLACQQAKIFAEKAGDNWQVVLEQTRKDLKKDPNQPGDPVPTGQLEQIRTQIAQARGQMQQIRQMAEKNPQMASYLLNQLQYLMIREEENVELLDKSVKLARTLTPEDTMLPVLEQPESLQCLVFNNLKAVLPNQTEYLNRKSLATLQEMAGAQGPLLLVHFNPKNIIKRNGFTEIAPEKPEDSEDNSSKDQEKSS